MIPLALCALAGLSASAAAQAPGAEHAGTRPTSAPVVHRPPLAPSPDGRTAIRGCPAGHSCTAPADDPELRALDLEIVPRPGGSPWMDDADPDADGTGAGLGERVTPRGGTADQPPDLPWLKGLAMPDLPVRWDQRVIDFLAFYKDDRRGQNVMRGWLEAQGRYRDLILSRLRTAGLPEDLLYVAMIESSYDSLDYSRVGASGLWQFMPAGGRIYGLRIDRWVDERNDPLRSTDAVLMYFADLYQRFGDWDLALAAYNAGYGAVIKSIAKYNTNDFWTLLEYENGLPWESSVYVPKALACAIIGKNRARFGFADVAAEPTETWDDVAVPSSVALSVVARAAGATVAQLMELNPHLRRKRTPPGDTAYVVRVPTGGGARFAASFPGLRDEWDRYDEYVVAYGERFEDIATRFGIARGKLRELNDVEHETEIGGGTVLLVPRVSDEEQARNVEKAKEALYASGVDGEKGEAMIVALPDPTFEVAGKRRVFYRVVNGDSQTRVATAFGVTVAKLAAWNGLDPKAYLQARMVLQVFVDPAFDAAAAKIAVLDETRILLVVRGSEEHLALSEQRIGRERFIYTAKKVESLETIGKKFGLSSRDVGRINRIAYDTVLAVGDEIVMYRVVDGSKSKRAAKQAKAMPKDKAKAKAKAPAGAAAKAAPTEAAGKAAEPSKSSEKPAEPPRTTGKVADKPTAGGEARRTGPR